MVTGAHLASGPGPDGVWSAGDTVEAVVQFSEAVTVDTSGGEPTLAIVLGGQRREAVYVRGSGTAALTFRHVVDAADDGALTARVVAGGLSLNGATIRNAAGVDAELGFVLAPAVTSVAVAPDGGDGTWSPDEAVTVTVGFSDEVTVDTAGGTPAVAVLRGGWRARGGLRHRLGHGDAALRLHGDGGRRGGDLGAGSGERARAERRRHCGADGARGGARASGGEPHGDARSACAIGGRRVGGGGRDAGLRGDARPCGGRGGRGGLDDQRRHGAGGRGLRCGLGQDRLRARRDVEDGAGRGARRPRGRGRGDDGAHALERHGRGARRRHRDGYGVGPDRGAAGDIGGRRPGPGGSGRGARLRGDARPGVPGDGDGGLGDARRRRESRREGRAGLCGGLGDAGVRPRRDIEDGPRRRTRRRP